MGAVLSNRLRELEECVEFTMKKRQGIIYRVSVTCAAQTVARLHRVKKCRLAPRSQGLQHCGYSTVILVSYSIHFFYVSLVKYTAQVEFRRVLCTAVRPVQLALYHPLLCMGSPVRPGWRSPFQGWFLSCMACSGLH